jgi:transposase
MAPTKTVTIPNVELTLDQLVSAIRQLEPETRSQIAKILVETELDARLTELIGRLADKQAANDITDAEISAEVNAVRAQRRQSC